MVLVAVAMIAMIAMAALSIDLVTLYLDREEAQRSADAAALSAARVLSLSGVTGDPGNLQNGLPAPPWNTACTLASQMAMTVANQNNVAQTAPSSVVVTFLYNGSTTTDCSAPSPGFPVNPQVQVQVIRQALPVFFSRIWGNAGNSVSATAVAEAYNPSGSAGLGSGMVPVSPRCTKPWIVANLDPDNVPNKLVNNDGSIVHPGISLNGTSTGGVIGEAFQMADLCTSPGTCTNGPNSTPTTKPNTSGVGFAVQYFPALVGSPPVAVPNCADSAELQQAAAAGCDQATNYSCGVVNGAVADLTQNPAGASSSTTAAQCLIHQAGNGDTAGQDALNTSAFPFQITAGDNNPFVPSGTLMSVSNSIVTVPIYDGNQLGNSSQPQVTIVGFLQLFIDNTDSTTGVINAHVLNVSGCSNGSIPVGTAVNGSSPVPVRLITPQ
jgi:hypothetical protein